ncbi:MAG: hypothetical protein UU85_C0001G0009 [Candidatus Wolfebacteria bacterium GW2011_GWA2_42_10]|uniref:DUF1573 domain-containing protein n=2 Tax=Candidatus Wolfeibacteriota TaxID=1752735 RepID=A0A0G0XKZ5_9BACT|nr:MAG: hypothetical protein UU38_C0003G0077 [Candidatus Wolfebacteria bacterium GW2011_GWB1_41_12]KKS25580.1 MAG: hypothetical protein UU85_C0001G0009 [Candidatus Wolfebacteria bacterium GW2011_GWA2_42_10]KKT56529.1 MAG: hypothetical protein UW50_C0001G0097 [Candidatus Wolfebacteria bacterium GW2011_GWA1_44_24]
MKNKNIIIIAIIVILVIGGLIWFLSFGTSRQNSGAVNVISNSALVAEEPAFDFGTIPMADGNAFYKFKLKNEGNEKIIIKKVYTSCMCTTAVIIDENGKELGIFGMPGHGGGLSAANIEVKNGESIIVEAVFDPVAHGPEDIGKVKRLIYLETNSKINPTLQLSIEANVIK